MTDLDHVLSQLDTLQRQCDYILAELRDLETRINACESKLEEDYE